MSFPRYPAYKVSGVEWLGEVPAHWQVTPLKHLAEFINGDAFKPAEWAETGVPIIRIQNLNGGEEFNYFAGEVEPRYLVHDGDLLFGWSGNRGTSFGPFLWRHDEVCALNQHIFRVVPLATEKHSLFWTLRAVTTHVEDQAHGIIGMVHVTKGDLGAINVPVPPASERQRIARFLDREAAKIDSLVTEQQRLMDLLKKKRQAVISHAVTKGLNPDAPMKPSGVEWIGDVPTHWEVKRIKHVVEERGGIQMGPFGGMLLDLDTHDTGYKVFGQENTISGDLTRGSRWVREHRYKELGSYHVRLGDVLITRKGSLGNAHLVQSLPQPGIFDSDTIRLRANAAVVIQRFLVLLLHEAPYVVEQIVLSRRGAILAGLNSETIANLVILTPPANEQAQIVSDLATTVRSIDDLSTTCEHVVDLLQERRTALISAAVTGQIDVRNLPA